MKLDLMGLDIGKYSYMDHDSGYFSYFDFKPSKDFLTRFPNFISCTKEKNWLCIFLEKGNMYFRIDNEDGDTIFNSKLIIETARLEIINLGGNDET